MPELELVQEAIQLTLVYDDKGRVISVTAKTGRMSINIQNGMADIMSYAQHTKLVIMPEPSMYPHAEVKVVDV